MASQSCQLFYFMTKLPLWQSLRSQCFVLLMNFLLGFFYRQGLDSGSNDLIVKPFEAEMLKEKAGFFAGLCGFL